MIMRIYDRWLKWYYTKRKIPFVVVHDKFGNYIHRVETMTPEQMWDKFIAHLNEVQPLKGDDAKHMNFLGSVAAYRKLFMEANKPPPNSDRKS